MAAVMLLAGLVILLLAVAVGLVAVTAWYVLIDSSKGYGLSGNTLRFAMLTVAVIAITVTAWRAAAKAPSPEGVSLDTACIPELWELVGDLAARLEVRPPDEIVLMAGTDVHVAEEAEWLGLLPGRRQLRLGVAGLMCLSVGELKTVLVHELSHYARRDTRFDPVVFQGSVALQRAIARMDPFASDVQLIWLVRPFLLGYSWIFHTVARPIQQRQELAADRAAVALAGKAPAISALRKHVDTDQYWAKYLDACHVDKARDYVLAGIHENFRGFLTAVPIPVGAGPLPKPSESSRWDTHPPVSLRIGAMREMDTADWSPSPADERPASDLLPAFDTIVPGPDLNGKEGLDTFGTRLDMLLFPALQRPEPRPLTEHVRSVCQAKHSDAADVLYRVTARFAKQADAGLTDVLKVLADGAAAPLAAALTRARPTQARWDDTDESLDINPTYLLTSGLASALAVTAVSCEAAHWHQSWPWQIDLLASDGTPMDVWSWANDAVSEPKSVPGVKQSLAEARVREDAGHPIPSAASVDADVIGAMANARVNGNLFGRLYDVLICSRGLVFLPGNRRDFSKARMAALVDELRSGEQRVSDVSLAYEDIRAATVLHHTRANICFTCHDGTTVKVQETIKAGQYVAGQTEGDSHRARAELRKVASVIQQVGSATGSVAMPRRRARRSRGTNFIAAGALLLLTMLITAVIKTISGDRIKWSLWLFAAVGAVLVVLGTVRRRGR
ncbi:M48 family metallopeptidase [Streptomyces dangxiongensis]|uniref:M48 family metallopeptidase n=1 Tax=Streptomyces dangxiongensis TaxID=1442032 RepID=UPI0013CF34BF|nr:M48 family metallopeptidase [Streptomyces dangxiongensis]